MINHQNQNGVRRRYPALLSAALVALVALCASVLPGMARTTEKAQAAALPAAKAQPFTVGQDGYACYRIPQLVSMRPTVLLAFAEARVKDCGDVGDIDIVVKRSSDQGRTWGPLEVVRGADDNNGYGNPVPVVIDPDDQETGSISLLYAYNEVKNGARQARELRVTKSLDYGENWSAHLRTVDRAADHGWQWLSVGPGKGVHLPGGRMVVSGEYGLKDESGNDLGGGAVFYHSDDGLHWKMGARSEAAGGEAYPTEPSTAVLPDGRIYVNSRSSKVCTTRDRRIAATIGATEVADPAHRVSFMPVAELEAPPVSASLLQMRGPGAPLLYSAPVRPGAESNDRFTLAVRASKDGGATWPTTGAVVHPLRAGYSDMAALGLETVGLLYETAGGSSHGHIKFSWFTLDELTAAAQDLRATHTSDTGPFKYNAVVQGGAQLTRRKPDDNAMAFDGTDDAVRVPCSERLRLGTKDFTVSAWVRFTSTAQQRIILGHGIDDAASRWGISAEGGHITAEVEARDPHDTTAPVTVRSRQGAWNDGAWHFVVFQRQGGQLSLAVDGSVSDPVTGPLIDLRITKPAAEGTGERKDDDPFSVRLGSTPQYTEHFTGAMDEVVIHARALSQSEIDALRADGDVPTDKVLNLSFNTLWQVRAH